MIKHCNEGWLASCPLDVFGRELNEDNQAPPCGFTSAEHLTEKLASSRLDEHKEEHETNEPMREIAEFNHNNREKIVQAWAEIAEYLEAEPKPKKKKAVK